MEIKVIWPESGDTEDLRCREVYRGRDEEEPLLTGLDGILPWPGKSKRMS
jgi:hypothetical protein